MVGERSGSILTRLTAVLADRDLFGLQTAGLKGLRV